MVRQSRSPGYYSTSHWFQGAIVLVLLGTLAIVLLSALDDIEERAEKLMVELTIRNARTGMLYAMGEALMRQRPGELATPVGSNPVAWLGAPPSGYRGECSTLERHALAAGQWCFDRESRELAYRPRHADHLRSPGRPCSQLSWRTVRAPEGGAAAGLATSRIEMASPCRWILDPN